jgi:hypothetical protein
MEHRGILEQRYQYSGTLRNGANAPIAGFPVEQFELYDPFPHSDPRWHWVPGVGWVWRMPGGGGIPE